jgi:hypothetical protein
MIVAPGLPDDLPGVLLAQVPEQGRSDAGASDRHVIEPGGVDLKDKLALGVVGDDDPGVRLDPVHRHADTVGIVGQGIDPLV